MKKRLSHAQRLRAAGAAIIRRPLIATLVLVGGSVGGAGIVAVSSVAGGAPAAAAATTATPYAPDLDSLLDGRSPGSRGSGWLFDTKPAYDTADLMERVLPSVRRRPVFPGAPATTSTVVPVAPLDLLPDGFAPADGIVGPDGPGSFAGVPGGFPVPGGVPGGVPIVGGIPGGGGVGGGGNPGSGGDPGTQVPTPASPVPEPGTWMMLILGFMLVGTAMRRRGGALAVT